MFMINNIAYFINLDHLIDKFIELIGVKIKCSEKYKQKIYKK